ncbi:hypothetical protein FRC07_009986 [Ceratobasidium sp. 392]|nr:hypothetical protein FRC07_009986 [Ceratobasidium sp. 392]
MPIRTTPLVSITPLGLDPFALQAARERFKRPKALKADDEEAYLTLIDAAKDTRITHLLKQTNSYLDSLSPAIVAQQNDDIHRGAPVIPFETEDGPASEATFGAVRMDDPNE